MMDAHGRASKRTAASYDDLARKVCRELELAALTVSLNSAIPHPPGAEVEVDLGNDDGAGVYVRWNASPPLIQDAMESVRSGQLNHSSIQHSGHISSIMHTAILAVLNSAGFVAEAARDEYRPFSVKVISWSGPEGIHANDS